MLVRMDALTSAAGFVAPAYLYEPTEYPYCWLETVYVESRLRRAWHRLTGWSTAWTVEHWVWEEPTRLRDVLPVFTASRGGLDIPA